MLKLNVRRKLQSKGIDVMKITLKRSLIGTKKDHRATVHALGLRKVGQSCEVKDNSSVRGMVNKVAYLLSIEDNNEA